VIVVDAEADEKGTVDKLKLLALNEKYGLDHVHVFV
jgi:hypothetical protein